MICSSTRDVHTAVLYNVNSLNFGPMKNMTVMGDQVKR